MAILETYIFVCLLKRVCPNVQKEPHLTLITGETFSHDTAITDPGARLDIKARNFCTVVRNVG